MGTKKTARTKKTTASRNKKSMNLYTNLTYRRRVKADQRARKQAEDLASLPKNPITRFFAKLRPDRVFHFWFSREGFFRILKFFAAVFLLAIIGVGGLFLYFKKDLADLNPENLHNSVSNTVNTYLDRNGVVLWEDKGDGDYRLVVEGSEISTYMRQATVAIEDKNFYNHVGIDPVALVRAAWVTLTGGAVQGGSTLTQQLIKQVYFSDEASNRDITGIPRKIKETILAIEIEKMYDKEQIITLYLNESPYGGRRNGVESGAQTYFGKSSKDLTIAEAALLAAIPNNPAVLNPYNSSGHKLLLQRQHHVLDSMVEMGYITKDQSDEAKAVDILETIRPEASQYENIKAPWFVLEVKSQLEAKYGIRVMRAGGFTITTTLDYRAQAIAENAVAEGAAIMKRTNNSDNLALTSIDVETSQVITMVGSAGWNIPDYGQVNAATSLLEPASTIKPILDYAPLFMEKSSGQNWGPGSILTDENIDAIYCAGYVGTCRLRNANGKFSGNIPIRLGLGGSLNIPAVKALYINGISNSLPIAHALGDVSYCANGSGAGLSMGIGGGCAVRPVEHANAYASLARGGAFKPLSYWLEVKNSSGDIIESWEDTPAKQVVDPQVAYMVTDILADLNARRPIFGSIGTSPGFYSSKVWFAAKTGTTENGNGRAKDSWIMTYSPVLATAIWNGNHDGSPLSNDSHTTKLRVSANYIEAVHEQVYGADGKWRSGDRIPQPAGIQTLTVNGRTDIWPSWYNEKTSGVTKEDMTFDSVSKKLATECTPSSTRVSITVSRTIDPMTKKEVLTAGDGYDPNLEDDLHSCTDVVQTLGQIQISGDGTISVTVGNLSATHALEKYTIVIDGNSVATGTPSRGQTITYTPQQSTFKSVTVTITDVAGYTTSAKANH